MSWSDMHLVGPVFYYCRLRTSAANENFERDIQYFPTVQYLSDGVYIPHPAPLLLVTGYLVVDNLMRQFDNYIISPKSATCNTIGSYDVGKWQIDG